MSVNQTRSSAQYYHKWAIMSVGYPQEIDKDQVSLWKKKLRRGGKPEEVFGDDTQLYGWTTRRPRCLHQVTYERKKKVLNNTPGYPQPIPRTQIKFIIKETQAWGCSPPVTSVLTTSSSAPNTFGSSKNSIKSFSLKLRRNWKQLHARMSEEGRKAYKS